MNRFILFAYDTDIRDIPVWAWQSLLLFGRWKTYGVLPVSGGLMEQEERTMQILDILSSELSAWESEKRKTEQAKMSAKSGRGR